MNILFFTPHVALWVHTVPEAYLARSLSEYGHKVKYLTCGGVQTYCSPMTAYGLEPKCDSKKSADICKLCKKGADSLKRMYDFSMQTLADFLLKNDYLECEEIAHNSITNRNLNTRYLDVDVGKFALYEFILSHKKISTNLTELQWIDYGIYLRNSLVSLRAFSRYLDVNKIDVIATFSPQYSNISPCMQHALNKGIRVLFMEAGNNLSHRLGTMRVWDWGIHKLVNPGLQYWGDSAMNPVSLVSAKAVVNHYKQLLSGEHFCVFSESYSNAKSIRERWSVPQEKKILLMTLSSYDEAYAAFLIGAFPENKVFSSVYRTQVEWLQATIKWVSERSDLFLVIRVHPRDFPNKRDQVQSEQSLLLEGCLKNLPSNVYVNWPIERISLYEIFEDTSVILTGWSVTGVEGLTLGIPLVTYDSKLPSYPSDIMFSGRTEQEYFSNIEKALNHGWSIKNVINGFRWMAYNFVFSTIILSARFGRHELGGQTSIRKLFRRIKNLFPSIGQSLDLLGWRQALDEAKIVNQMLIEGYDSIPAVRSKQRYDYNDLKIVRQMLRDIYQLLYKSKNFPSDKKGLSQDILKYLES